MPTAWKKPEGGEGESIKSSNKVSKPTSSFSPIITPSSTSWKSLSDEDLLFGPDKVERKQRQFCLIHGDTGAGKTSFLTRYAPDPILLLNFDYRADDAVEEARSVYGKTISYHVIDIPSEHSSSEAIKIAAREKNEEMIAILSAGVRLSKQGKIRSIGIDTSDECDALFNSMFFGDFGEWNIAYNKDKPFIKRQWMRVIRLLKQSDAHIVITARTKEVWGGKGDNKGPTGKFRPDGAKIVEAAVDWAGHIRTVPRMTGDGKKFEIEVTKGGVNIGEEGKVYVERDWNKAEVGPFAYSAMKIYGGERRDWE